MLLLVACSTDPDPTPAAPDAGPDITTPEDIEPIEDTVPPPEPDVPEDVAVEDVPPPKAVFPAKKAALIIDFDMKAAISWRIARDTLEARGFEVQYRRWFPHITAADVTAQEGGEHPYALIVVGGGAGINRQTEVPRQQDEDRLAAFAAAGGAVVLLPRNSWLDSTYADLEWLHFNGILNAGATGVRIDKNTTIGHVSFADGDKPPLHFATAAGYPGSLEWTINLPLGYPVDDHPIAKPLSVAAFGYTPTLSCDSDEVALLATTWSDAIQWWDHAGLESSVAIPGVKLPLVVVAPAGDGVIGVASRTLLTLAAHSGEASDKPLLNLAFLDGTQALGEAFLGHVADLVVGAAEHTPNGCHGGEPLSSSVSALLEPSERPVGETAPQPPSWAGDLTAVEPADSQPSTTPAWFTDGRAHMGYGGLVADDDLVDLFTIAAENGLDSVQLSVPVGSLVSPSDGVSPFAVAAEAADGLGIHLLAGVHYKNEIFGGLKAEIGTAIGAYGHVLDAPPPLSEAWWKAGIEDIVLGAATASLAHPGVRGVHFDMELYGSQSLLYHDGHAFDAETWSHALAALAAHDEALAAAAEALQPTERLAWLVDNGLLGFVYASLEQVVAKRAAAIREAAHAIAPGFTLAFYMPVFNDSWFYRGLMRGFGTAEQPAIVLSYDAATARLRDSLARDGIHIRHLGGLLGVLYQPLQFEDALVGAAARSDGYWLFSLNDFPPTEDPDFIAGKNGAPLEYWQKVSAANTRLKNTPL